MDIENLGPKNENIKALESEKDKKPPVPDIMPLYRGLWKADEIKDGDQIPVGGSIFSDDLDTIMEVDTDWIIKKTQRFTRERLDELFKSENEKIFKPWIEKNAIKLNPEIFHILMQVQRTTRELLEVVDGSVASKRKDLYLVNKKAKLSEFIGQSECAEQAVVAKILLDKIGVKSVLMEGVHVDSREDSLGDHTFLILEDTQGEGSLIFDVARPKASVGGYPRILRSNRKLEYSTFKDKDNYVVPVVDVYNGTTLYYGVGNPHLLQDVNFTESL